MSDLRFDAARFSKTKITDEGYLETEAIVTRSGIFSYRNSDGSTRRELRHPDDIFKLDSIASMKMIPITDGHPESKLVDSKNAKELKVGHVGESVKVDGRVVKAPLVITDSDAIAKVQNGKNQLSLGYTADVINESGEYNGQKYDCRQTNIKYNHLATCPRARAGSDASIKLDAGDAVQIEDESKNDEFDNKKIGSIRSMKKITIDNIDYEAAPEVSNAYTKSLTRSDELSAELEASKGICDAMKAEKEALQVKVDEFDSTFAEKLDAAVKERVTIVDAATKILAKEIKLDGISNSAIKKAVIETISKEAKLDDKSEDYINARFDAALEMNLMRTDVSGQRKQVGTQAGTSEGSKSILNDAQDRYLKRLNNIKEAE